jgi:hypothetical protein
MKLLVSITLLLAAASTDAFVTNGSPKVAFRSTNLLASRDSEGSSLSDNLKHFAIMTAVTFTLLASPAPSLADGMFIQLNCGTLAKCVARNTCFNFISFVSTVPY